MSTVVNAAREEKKKYRAGEDRPLGSYAATMGAYGLLVGGAVVAAKATGRKPPAAMSVGDVALMAVTTHKVARLLAKDPVTSPLRAPFTQFRGVAGPAELDEEVRGRGIRHAVGELLSCPFRMAQWVATGYAAGMVFAPRMTRLAGAAMTAVAGADWMQLAYDWLQQRAEGDGGG